MSSASLRPASSSLASCRGGTAGVKRPTTVGPPALRPFGRSSVVRSPPPVGFGVEQNNEISPTAEAENFDPTFRRHELRFTCGDTKALAEWMGDPPAGFEHKWAIDSREQYRMLKERAYEEYTIRTIE